MPSSDEKEYRKFTARIEQALKEFEGSHTTWADLIAALQRLSKELQKAGKFGDIPKPVTVSKRLSQCLNPSLPAGVHKKTLEIYRQIFAALGNDGLVKVLDLFSVGLFPLLDYCGIQVKKELLTLYEAHFVPLGAHLRPSLVGLITAILPTLEEGNEFYEKTNALLESISKGVGQVWFYSGLWQVVYCAPRVRHPALHYVANHFDKGRSLEDQLNIIGNNMDTMVEAICKAARDSETDVLAKRQLLDFLTTAFPVNSKYVERSDMIRLIQSAIVLVLDRDMSLNRRLYSWFLGVNNLQSQEIDTKHFKEHSLPLISKGFESVLMDPDTRTAQVIEICRVMKYLLDRPEVGGPVLSENLIYILLYFRSQIAPDYIHPNEKRPRRQKSKSAKECDSELSKTLKMLLDYVGDGGYVWNHMCRVISCEKADSPNGGQTVSLREAADIIYCLMGFHQLDLDGEMHNEYLPLLLRSILIAANNTIMDNVSIDGIDSALSIALLLLCEIQPTIVQPTTKAEDCEIQNKNNEGKESRDEEDGEKDSSLSTKAEDATSMSSGYSDSTSGADTSGKGQKIIEECRRAFLQLLANILRLNDAAFRRSPMSKSSPNGADIQVVNIDPADSWQCTILACHLLREFVDFPFYSTNIPHQLRNAEQLVDNGDDGIPSTWLVELMKTSLLPWDIDDEVFAGVFPGDARKLREIMRSMYDYGEPMETLLYVYVNSNSIIEQREAAERTGMDNGHHGQSKEREQTAIDNGYYSSNGTLSKSKLQQDADSPEHSPATCHIFLDPILSKRQISWMIKSERWLERTARYLWDRMDAGEGRIGRLLWLLHNADDTTHQQMSSHLEDIIVADLSNPLSQRLRSQAVRKFTDLWLICRNELLEKDTLTLKPFHRVILLILSGAAKMEYWSDACRSFVQDCVVHGDTGRILQLFLLFLYAPSTARVSIQYVTLAHQSEKVSINGERKEMEVSMLKVGPTAGTLYHLRNYHVPIGGISFDDQRSSGWLKRLKRRMLDDQESRHLVNQNKSDVRSSQEGGQQASPGHRHHRHRKLSFDSDIPLVEAEMVDGVDGGKKAEREGDEESVDEVVRLTLEEIVDCVVNEIDGFVVPNLLTTPLLHRTAGLLETAGSTGQPQDDSDIPIEIATDAAYAFLPSTNSPAALSSPSPSMSNPSSLSNPVSPQKINDLWSMVNPIHAHFLVYCEGESLHQSEFVFSTLSSLLQMHSLNTELVSAMASNNIGMSGNSRNQYSTRLCDWINKHFRRILGKDMGQTGGEAENGREDGRSWNSGTTTSTTSRQYMLLELFINAALHHLRSYYLNSPLAPVSSPQLATNWKTKIACLQFLSNLLDMLSSLVDERGRAFSSYIEDVLSKSRVQKSLLHCLMDTVQTFHQPDTAKFLSDDVLKFNMGGEKGGMAGTGGGEESGSGGVEMEPLILSYQQALLNSVVSLIRLEHVVLLPNNSNPNSDHPGAAAVRLMSLSRNTPLVHYKLFLITTLNALKSNRVALHVIWLKFIGRIMGYLDKSLPRITQHICDQLGKNLQMALDTSYPPVLNTNFVEFPVNYVSEVLEWIGSIWHRCLLSPGGGSQPSSMDGGPVNNHPSSSPSPSGTGGVPGGGGGGAVEGSNNSGNGKSKFQLFNFWNGILFSETPVASTSSEGVGSIDYVSMAKDEILDSLPDILSTFCNLWSKIRSNPMPIRPVGAPQAVRRLMLDVLGPLSVYYSSHFLSALALVWLTKSNQHHRQKSKTNKITRLVLSCKTRGRFPGSNALVVKTSP